MNRHLTSLIALGLCSLVAGASQLTPEEALGRLDRVGGIVHKIAATGKPQLAYTASTGNVNQFYVFNNPNRQGFTIVAADDCVTPLLGFSEESTFDYDSMPDNMKAWLESYQSQIEWAIANGIDASSVKATAKRDNIAPLIQTRWDQGSPYNDLCPVYNESEHTRCATGCVATAMAQIMKFHEWPVKGKGSNSYRCYNYTYGIDFGTLSMNFGDTTFDWANMTDRYNSSSTQEQKDAVATLMYACGISVNMGYGPSSGAQSTEPAWAFVNNFDYDKGTTYYLRDYFSGSEWEEMMYNELAARRPIMYDGVTDNREGHEFVCDGYRDGYFHINWGWGGMSDGYFLLSALDPGVQGTGGATSGFNFQQGATIGIQRPVNGSKDGAMLAATRAFYTDKETYRRNETFQIRNREYVYLPAKGQINVRLGLKLTDSEGKERYIYSSDGAVTLTGMSTVVTAYPMYGGNFPQSGNYIATPAFYNTETEEWHDILIPINYSRGFNLVIEGDNLTFTPLVYAPELKISNVQVLTPLYNKVNFHITATATVDNQEFYGSVLVALFKKGSTGIANRSSKMQIDVEPGQPFEIDIISQFTRTATAGEYELVFIDENNNRLSDPVTVNFLGTLQGTTTLEVVKFSPESNSMPQNHIKLNGTIKCTSGQLAEPLSIYLFSPDSNYSVALWQTEPIWLSEGESTDFSVEGEYLDGPVGVLKTYTAVIAFNNEQLTPYARFRLKKATSGIEDVTEGLTAVTPNPADSYISVTAPSINTVDIYSITGLHVLSVDGNDTDSLGIDVSGLASGNYIITVKGNDEITTLRFIKK